MFAASKSGKVAAAAATTDPYFPYVPLLLETTSTNGQQNNTVLDSSTNNFTITRNGTPTQGSITPYWPNGQWSNYFDGSSAWLSASPNTVSVLNFGTNPYTVEFWFYGLSKTTNQMLCRAQNATGSLEIFINTSGVINFGTQSTATYVTIPSASWNINTWNHIAFVRTGTGAGQLTAYVNGASAATGTDSFNYTITGVDIGAATNYVGGYYLNGYLSNLRVVNGKAVYTGAFTPPTAPLTSTTGGTNPPTGTQCTLLTCYSNRFIDANTAVAAKTFTVTGTPRVQAFQPFSPTASYTTALYGGSGYFNGTSDYVSTASNAALTIGSGSATVEFWVYPTAVDSIRRITTSTTGSFATGSFFIRYTNGSFWAGGVPNYITSSTIPAANTWSHVAWVGTSGTSQTLYINGGSVGTAGSYNITEAIQFFGGFAASGPTEFYSGYISNLRVVKGTAVYTGAFKPPTLAPLTTLGTTSAASYTDTTNVNTTFTSGTGVLLNMANAGIYDAAAQNNMITVGDAQASTTQSKWSPSSMKYDGTGDWLTAIDNPQLQLGTGDFTIEGWFYLTANGTAYGIVSKGAASTGWSVNVTSGNRIQFSYTAANLTGATTTLAASTWYYFAVVRSGSATGNLKIYINGALEVTSGGAVTDNFNQTNILYVGASRTGTTPLNGYLQDIRITTAARTITASPTAPFPTR